MVWRTRTPHLRFSSRDLWVSCSAMGAPHSIRVLWSWPLTAKGSGPSSRGQRVGTASDRPPSRRYWTSSATLASATVSHACTARVGGSSVGEASRAVDATGASPAGGPSVTSLAHPQPTSRSWFSGPLSPTASQRVSACAEPLVGWASTRAPPSGGDTAGATVCVGTTTRLWADASSSRVSTSSGRTKVRGTCAASPAAERSPGAC